MVEKEEDKYEVMEKIGESVSFTLHFICLTKRVSQW